MLEIIILSIVQGITEFLPISSSAHLIIISKYFNFSNQNLNLDVSLHLGSLIAITFYFKEYLLDFTNNKLLLLKIILSSLPVLIFGYILIKLDLINNFRNYKIIGWSTIFFGILLYFSDSIKVKKKFDNNFKYRTALYIGLFQILSLIPGVSRSGITITGSRFLNFNRVDSAKISFLTSVPTLAAVGLFNIFSLIKKNSFDMSILNLTAIFFAFIVSYLTIKYFLNYIKKFNLTIFVIYRLLTGLIILFFSYL